MTKKKADTDLKRRKTTTGNEVQYPGQEHTNRKYKMGDDAVMPKRYPDETYEEYSHRVKTGAL